MKNSPSSSGTPDPRDALFDTTEVEKGLKRKTAAASFLILSMAALKTVQQFAAIAILARLIPPSEYGIYALAVPAVMLGMALSTFGLPQALVQRREMTHDLASTLFWLNVIFGLAAAGLVAAVALPAAAYYDELRVVPVFYAVTAAVFFAALAGLYSAVLRRQMRFRELEVTVLFCELAGLAIAVIAAFAGLSYWALVLQQLSIPFLTLVSLMAITGWRPSLPHRMGLRRAWGAVAFGGWVGGFTLLNHLVNYMGTVITGGNFSEVATSLFYRSRNLANLPTLKIVRPLSNVLIPSMSRLQDQPEELRDMFRTSFNRLTLLMFPVGLVLWTAAEPVTLVLLGPNWIEVAPLLAWMSAFTFIAPAEWSLRFVLLGCGHSRGLFLLTALRLAAISAALMLAAPYGLERMVAAYVVTELSLTVPAFALLTLRITPISLADIWRSMWIELALIGWLAALLTLWVMPAVAGRSAALQLAAAGLVIVAGFGARIAASPVLRRQALGALAAGLGRLRRRKGQG